MNLDRRMLAIAAVAVIALVVIGTGGMFLWNMFTAEPESPQAPATPEPAPPAPTVAAPATPEPVEESAPSSFINRDVASGAGQQVLQDGAQPQQGAQTPGLPVRPQAPPGASDWSPVFGVGPQTAFSGQESFAGPEGTPVPGASPEAQPTPPVVEQQPQDEGTTGDDRVDKPAPAPETPGAPLPGLFAVQPQPTAEAEALAALVTGETVVQAPLTAHADDLIVLSQGLFGRQESYRMGAVLEYRLRFEGGDVYIPVHVSVQENRPNRYRSDWVVDPFDESGVDTVVFDLTKIDERVFVGGDVGIGDDLMYQDIPLEFDLCVLLVCSVGKAGFSGAAVRSASEDGSTLEIFARQSAFGPPLQFLNGYEADVIYIIDSVSGMMRTLDLRTTVPLDTSLDSGDMEVSLRVEIFYEDVRIIDPEAPPEPIPTPVVETQVIVAPTPVVVEPSTPAETVVAIPTPGPVDGEGTAEAPVPTPVPPSVEVVDGGDDSSDKIVKVLSHGYEVMFPREWFIYDASVFGNLLGGRISDGLRGSFAGEPRPHLVALDGFDAMPYVVLSQHGPPRDGVGLDTFSHLEFQRQTERKILPNRGWAVSLMENVQGYEGRLYRYETTRDTVEWMVFFLREHDVIQVLMEADVSDGEDIDYDRQFRQIVREMRFGSSIGDDGSRPLSEMVADDYSLASGNPHVVGVSYLGEIISVRFSEPVWVSSAEGVFVRVLRKGAAHCELPCDGADTTLEFHMPGLVDEDVVDGFIFGEADGSIRDLDGNGVPHRFVPFTKATYPVVVATHASVSGAEFVPGDVFTVEFSEPVWVAQGDIHLVGTDGGAVVCTGCPAAPETAAKILSFGWQGGLGVPDDLPRAGDFIFRIDGSGVVLSVDGVIADSGFDPIEVRDR